jgi:type IV pilus assembly protein PilF
MILQTGKISVIAFCIVMLTACQTTSNTSYSDTKKAKMAKANAQKGMAFLERNNLPQAKKKLTLAIEQGPNMPEPWYSMGYYLESTGKKNEANLYYVKAINIAPKDAVAQNIYGTYLCRQGRYQESLQHFMVAVHANRYSEKADAYENAGLCALKIPNQAIAERYFAEAVKYDPAKSASLYRLAEINFKNHRYAESKNYLQKFLTVSAPTARSDKLSKRLSEVMNDQS